MMMTVNVGIVAAYSSGPVISLLYHHSTINVVTSITIITLL